MCSLERPHWDQLCKLSLNFFISNPALDLAALSIPGLKIVQGTVTAAISFLFYNFSSAELSVGVTSQMSRVVKTILPLQRRIRGDTKELIWSKLSRGKGINRLLRRKCQLIPIGLTINNYVWQKGDWCNVYTKNLLTVPKRYTFTPSDSWCAVQS